jgi:hypothetical protein
MRERNTRNQGSRQKMYSVRMSKYQYRYYYDIILAVSLTDTSTKLPQIPHNYYKMYKEYVPKYSNQAAFSMVRQRIQQNLEHSYPIVADFSIVKSQ